MSLGRKEGLRLSGVYSYGVDNGRGNLVGVQPWMVPTDYTSSGRLQAKLAAYLDLARGRGWLSERTLVIFPEYIGSWLVVAGEGRSVYAAPTIVRAMIPLALRNARAFARAWRAARAPDRVRAALFQMKGAAMAAAYHDIFSALARTYGVTLVAGSIVLPAPRIEAGRIVAGREPLRNITAVYRPDGTLHAPLVGKAYPISDELRFLEAAPVADLPVFETPAGRLGVLICADAWYPDPWERLRSQGTEIVAVPSYVSHDNSWTEPWGGYDGAPPPPDVDASDVGRLTLGEAWVRYATIGRGKRAGIRQGMTVCLRGALWDLGTDGTTTAFQGEQAWVTPRAAGAAIVNLWLT